jgi:cyclophilin family peptidyl-prolyl cis-trans isomerase
VHNANDRNKNVGRRTARTGAALFVLAVVAALMVYAAAEERDLGSGGAASTDVAPTATQDLPCPQVEAPASFPRQYDESPDLDLQPRVDYTAVIRTSCGDIELDLLESEAPRTVANFVFLAEDGFYDGLTWHRIERNFVVGTGDPNGIIGREPDGPGYTIPDEFPPPKSEYVYGVVAMTNEGPGTGGSQFFIVVHDPEGKKEHSGINSVYSIFGSVAESSFDTLDKIAGMPVRGRDAMNASRPVVPVYIESVEIRREGPAR